MLIVLKGVHTVNAKGKVYRYAWRTGPRIDIDPAVDPEGFAGAVLRARDERKAGDARKIAGLCVMYRASPEWLELAAKTRKNWAPWLDRIQTHFGHLPTGAFDRPIIVKAIKLWRNGWRSTPRTADVAIQVLSRLLSWAGEEGMLATNAASKVGRLYAADRSDIIWTDDDLKELAKHASPEVMRAARLAALTGLRQGDLLRLSWSHVGANGIEVRTSKTGRTALIPLYAELRAFLATIPKRSPVILTTTKGRPWRTGFGASWQTAIKVAKVNKHFHDLRGTACTKLYLGDLSIREIAEIMAWSNDKVERLIDRYVKRDELLKDRIRRMDRNARRTKAVKPERKPGSAKGSAK